MGSVPSRVYPRQRLSLSGLRCLEDGTDMQLVVLPEGQWHVDPSGGVLRLGGGAQLQVVCPTCHQRYLLEVALLLQELPVSVARSSVQAHP